MNDRFKFRVWDKAEQQYNENVFHLSISGELQRLSVASGSFLETDPNRFVIEQCTGLRDKNGKLIYEGDILQCIDTKLIVCFNPEIAAFVFVRDFDIELCCGLELAITMRNAMSTDGAKYVSKRYEIIGNVHEMEVAE